MPRIHENPLGDDGLEALVSEILNLAATENSSTEGDKQQQQQQRGSLLCIPLCSLLI